MLRCYDVIGINNYAKCMIERWKNIEIKVKVENWTFKFKIVKF